MLGTHKPSRQLHAGRNRALLRAKNGMRCFADCFLSHFRTFQARRHRPADLLSLSPRPDQRRTLCIHARENPNAPSRFFAQRTNWTNLARISSVRFRLSKATLKSERITSSSGRSTPQRSLVFRTVRFPSLPHKSLQPSRRVLSKRAGPHAHEPWNRPVPQQESARQPFCASRRWAGKKALLIRSEIPADSR